MMKKRTSIALFVAALALTAQLALISPSLQAQNSNSSTTEQNANSSMTMQNSNTGIPDSPCRRKCRRIYRSCLNHGTKPSVCRARLRKCYARCPQ